LFLPIPAQINFRIADLDETKNRARRGVLRLVQIRLVNAEFRKDLVTVSRQFAAGANRRPKVPETRSVFSRLLTRGPSSRGRRRAGGKDVSSQVCFHENGGRKFRRQLNRGDGNNSAGHGRADSCWCVSQGFRALI
jgi:hypothetical protein